MGSGWARPEWSGTGKQSSSGRSSCCAAIPRHPEEQSTCQSHSSFTWQPCTPSLDGPHLGKDLDLVESILGIVQGTVQHHTPIGQDVEELEIRRIVWDHLSRRH